ncbi:MAG: hypothetical protein ACK50P_03700 [Planctomycetaceae bacterium]
MFLRVSETPERFVVTREVTPAGATGLDDTIRSGLRNACDEAERVRKRMLIDLRAVLLLDEMMVEVLATGHRCGTHLGVDVRFAVRENVLEVLTITQLHLNFRFDNDDQDLPE